MSGYVLSPSCKVSRDGPVTLPKAGSLIPAPKEYRLLNVTPFYYYSNIWRF